MKFPQAEQRQKRESFNWVLWLKWILASTLGWAFGVFVGVEFAIGAAVGALQWLVLRPLIRRDGWWIPASAAGWAGAAALVTFVLRPRSPIVAPALIGAGIGGAQWLVLRQEVHRAWWWIVLSALGWSLGMMGLLGPSLVGAVAGATTGVALEFLLRVRRSEPEAE
jgi:hypothetical protein